MSSPSRRALLLGSAIAPLAAPTTLAQAPFPNRTVSLIVPFPPGGTTDVVMRALAEGASRHLPQQVIIENRPGAANTLGAAAVARARPDGYLLAQLPASAIRVQILQNLPYDTLRDFTPILCVTGYTFTVIARRGRFPGGWRDAVAEARRWPGALSFGSTGANGSPHVIMALLAQREGIEMVHVPFRGDADGTQALLGGHIDIMAGGSGLAAQVDGGQAEFMHVWTAQRLSRWPQAPTLHDLGYNLTVTTPFGIVAPANLDPAVRATLHDAFRKSMQEPGFRAVLERFDMPDEYRDGTAYAALLREMVAEEHALIQRLGLRAS